MRKHVFIVNPKAGRGAGRRTLNELPGRLTGWPNEYQIIETSGPGEASEIARSVDSEVCVAVGGDGTINEVVNGLIGTNRTLAILPSGSGNDFAKSIGIPKSTAAALEIIRAGKSKSIDVGTVACGANSDSRNQSKRLFANGVGIGFDAAVAAKTLEIPHLSGTMLYLVAVLKTLGKYRSPLFHISIDGRTTVSHNLLIAIGNGVCAGGGFYLTPDAKVDDGQLDVCLVEEMSIAGILQLMPRVMKGKHGTFKGVEFQRGACVSIHGDAPFFVHADGEIVGDGVTDVQVSLVDQSLSVIVG